MIERNCNCLTITDDRVHAYPILRARAILAGGDNSFTL